MKDSLEDFFDAIPVEETEVNASAPDAEAEQAKTEESTEAEAPLEQKAEEAEPEKSQEPQMVPVAALTEQRRLARERADEVERLRRELEQFKSAPTQPVQPQQPQTFDQQHVPDPLEDPKQYHAFVMQQARQEFRIQNLAHSRIRAVEKHGSDAVNAAADWAGEQARLNPAFEETVLSQPDPAEWVIAQKKRSDLLKSFETDPDAYVRQRAEELGLTATPVSVQEAVTPPAAKDTGPASLVNAKSRNVNVSPKQAAEDFFDAMFRK